MSRPSKSHSKGNVFKFPNHANNISTRLQKFYKEEQFFDITLIAGIDDIRAKAHRVVLSASSDYFLTMFQSSLKESTAEEVKLGGIDGITLKLLLDFMYAASIELHNDTVENVLRAANLFQINDLIAACCYFMGEQLDPCNCLGTTLFAQQHDLTGLYRKSLAFVYNNFEEVCTQQEFLWLEEGQLEEFLSGDDLHITSQEKLFLSLVAWYKHDKANREQLICSLLFKYVRFILLEPKFIIDNRKKISHIPECSELMWTWLEWHSLSETPKKETKKIVFIYENPAKSKLNVQSFNYELNKWSHVDWPTPTKYKTAYSMLVINKKLIVAGGRINVMATNTVECLDLQSMEWYGLPAMGSRRCSPGMAVINGDLYVLGGWKDSCWLSSMEKYDFSTRKWENLMPSPSAICYVKLTVLNGLLYAVGDGQLYLDCYNPVSNRWTQTAPKIERSFKFAMAAVKGHLYAVGGEYNAARTSKTVERYDPSNNTWTIVDSLKVRRKWICCTVWNDRLLACGGLNECAEIAQMCEEYDPRTKKWKTLGALMDFNGMNRYNAHLTII